MFLSVFDTATLMQKLDKARRNQSQYKQWCAHRGLRQYLNDVAHTLWRRFHFRTIYQNSPTMGDVLHAKQTPNSRLALVFTDDEWDLLTLSNKLANTDLHNSMPFTAQSQKTAVIPAQVYNEPLLVSIAKKAGMKEELRLRLGDELSDQSGSDPPSPMPITEGREIEREVEQEDEGAEQGEEGLEKEQKKEKKYKKEKKDKTEKTETEEKKEAPTEVGPEEEKKRKSKKKRELKKLESEEMCEEEAKKAATDGKKKKKTETTDTMEKEREARDKEKSKTTSKAKHSRENAPDDGPNSKRRRQSKHEER